MQILVLRLILALSLLLGGCSVEDAIDRMASDEEKRFAQQVVTDLRTRNLARLREHFDPAAWAQSERMLEQAAAFYPPGRGNSRLIGYHHNTRMNAGGATERMAQYVLVTEGSGRWAVTVFETHSRGDARPRITGWRVRPSTERPRELAMVDASNRMVPYMRAVGVGFLLVLVGTLVAFIRYRRQKRARLTG
jgi:hypothetical protein